jgi:hypothetical protein
MIIYLKPQSLNKLFKFKNKYLYKKFSIECEMDV